MRLSPAKNLFAFPARPPRLNTNHPAYQNIRMAPIALPGAAMRDLVTNVAYGNPGGQSQTDITDIGHSVYPGANANLSYIAIPALIPGETLNEDTLAVIFQPRAFTVGQGMVGDNVATGGGFKIQCGNSAANGIQFVSLGSNIFTVPAVAGNSYFACVSVLKSRNAANFVVRCLTTGQLWVLTSGGVGGTAPTAGTSYNVVTYNTVSGVNPGRIACASLSAKYMRLADTLKWAEDPWSLWYAPPTMGATKTSPVVAVAKTNSPALMIGA